MRLYFTPGQPWIDESNLGQARCPIYMYGHGLAQPHGRFVFDATWRGGADASAKRHAYEIAVRTAMALTLAAANPDFDAARYVEIIEGQV